MESPPADETPAPPKQPRQLPSDLPTSLNDRRSVPVFNTETEIYDAWAGQSQFLTTPVPARPLTFSLSLDDDDDGRYHDAGTAHHRLDDSDDRLMQMMASSARLKLDDADDLGSGGGSGSGSGGVDSILNDATLSDKARRDTLQGMFSMAASNGQTDRVRGFLDGGARAYIDLDAADTEGTPPLIYASCFGHLDVVSALLAAGANVNKQDKNQWSSLMWAMTNRHKAIAKMLLDHGADPDVQSSTGRTAHDFLAPNSEMSDYLHESGYSIGNAGVAAADDFYNAGMAEDRFEEELAENEMRRRMMMESAINLEVDLGNLGLDEQPESPEEAEEGNEFVWDRCLPDQMFVFQENELDRILDIVITNMTPQRSPSQKPVPANIIFLSSRYAHYYQSPDLLERLLTTAMDKINDTVEQKQWDMTILAFWMSNCTLLLHYLKKDGGLRESTLPFQLQLAELINEIFILIIRDAERRMDKVLDAAMLEHQPIPGFEDVTFQNEWKIFKSKPKPQAPEPFEKRFRPPSPKRRMKPSPRNITSLLSSTLFVLDLYDVHSVITAQVLSQLFYWLSAELFNRILSTQTHLARTKAMQIRMNVSTLEDWARANNRQPEHYESGSMTSSGEATVDAARRHLEPVVQLLQWLQCFSSIGEDFEALVGTVQQLRRLSPQQLIHSVKYYRAEVGEAKLPKSGMKYLNSLQAEVAERRRHRKANSNTANNLQPPPTPTSARGTAPPGPASAATDTNPRTPTKSPANNPIDAPSPSPSTPQPQTPHYDGPEDDDNEDAPPNLLMDPAMMLPFSLPTATDMLISYGAGFGGTDRERERKYAPSVPAEFLARFETASSTANGGAAGGGGGGGYGGQRWD